MITRVRSSIYKNIQTNLCCKKLQEVTNKLKNWFTKCNMSENPHNNVINVKNGFGNKEHTAD